MAGFLPAWFSFASWETDGDQELRLADAEASMLKKDMMLSVQTYTTRTQSHCTQDFSVKDTRKVQ